MKSLRNVRDINHYIYGSLPGRWERNIEFGLCRNLWEYCSAILTETWLTLRSLQKLAFVVVALQDARLWHSWCRKVVTCCSEYARLVMALELCRTLGSRMRKSCARLKFSCGFWSVLV